MQIILGDCLTELNTLKDNSVDAIVTDPPYGLKFMGKKWDYEIPSVELWRECLRVLKPGGHVLIACGTRTQHRMAVNIEDAGFEIRDVITWLYGSGFPKSLDISKAIDKAIGTEHLREFSHKNPADRPYTHTEGETSTGWQSPVRPDKTKPYSTEAKQWQGFGTALKPAVEFWTLARKPLGESTVAKNVLKHGTGGINVDGCRVGDADDKDAKEGRSARATTSKGHFATQTQDDKFDRSDRSAITGRFPANLILDEEAGALLDEQSGVLKSGTMNTTSKGFGNSDIFNDGKEISLRQSASSGGASRFFYCAKSSKAERNAGLEGADLIWESDAWEKPDLKLAQVAINQLLKDTSEDTLTASLSWSTDLYGHSASEQYPLGMISTIETVSSLITELKTLSASPNSNTKDTIQDAIRTIEANGLSLAESVALLNQLNLNSINEKTASLLGVVRALLPTLLQIRNYAKSGNFHSTVKPIKLMRYLCHLITPPGGIVLDPFMGSGSTGVAAIKEGFDFIGIERETEYVEIAKKRIGNQK